jgi:hypothetical protein
LHKKDKFWDITINDLVNKILEKNRIDEEIQILKVGSAKVSSDGKLRLFYDIYRRKQRT